MNGSPPPDWSRIPSAHRAHLIDVEPSSDPPVKPRPGVTLLRKPLVWIMGVVLAGIAAFVGDYLSGFLGDAVAEVTTDPVLVYDVKQIPGPTRDRAGHVVPGDHSDLDAVSWDGGGNAAAGGTPDYGWISDRGGTAAGWGAWEVVLEAKRDSMITIIDIQPRNITCAEPINGTHFIAATQGEGEPTSLGITIDGFAPDFKVFPDDWYLLSDPDPDAAMASFADYGDDMNVTLNTGEQHVIRFFAHAAERSCTWQVALEYAANGSHQTVILQPGGEHAFTVAALLPIEQYGTVVLPFTYCDDYMGRAVSGERAATIIDAVATGSGPTNCT